MLSKKNIENEEQSHDNVINKAAVDLVAPGLEDGLAVYELIKRCPPLDVNSSYCNFLQCSHFSNTSVAAKHDKEMVGFISAYLMPSRPDTLFVWQVAVDQRARGMGVASQMLEHLLSRPDLAAVQYLETTITDSNDNSWGLFKRLAAKKNVPLESTVWLDEAIHFNGSHPSEQLVRIGPFKS